MISRTAYLAVALLWLPGLATAHNYSYLEGGYLGLDNELEEADGLFLGGSYGLFNHLAVIAEWDTAGDYDQLGAGVQYHRSLTEPLDLTLGATVEQLSVDEDDDTGYGLRAGLRWQAWNHRLELWPEARYVDALGDEALSGRLTATYEVIPRLDVLGIAQAGDDDRYGLGLRYSFGPRQTGH